MSYIYTEIMRLHYILRDKCTYIKSEMYTQWDVQQARNHGGGGSYE